MESLGCQRSARPDATLVLKGCRLVNVCSGEIYPTDVTILGDRIVSIARRGHYDDVALIDCEGMFVVPGLIDVHMHTETTFLCPGELARVVVPLGTTSLFVDTTNTAHSGGLSAINELKRSFAGVPLRGYLGAPSYCPLDPGLGTAAMDLTSGDIAQLLDQGCTSIGETVWTRMALGDFDYQRGVQTCREANLRVSGHGGEIPRGCEAAFDAYVSAGVQDDHCIGRPEDILPRLRRGLKMFFVECTGRRGQLRPLLDEMLRLHLSFRQVCLCTDNQTVMDMVPNGYGFLEYLVKIALGAGVPAIDAYRMVTLNPATHYRQISDIGCIAPGRFADLLLMRELDQFPPRVVIQGGRVVARDGVLVVDIPPPQLSAGVRNSIDVAKVRREDLRCAAPAGAGTARIRTFRVIDGDAFNTEVIEDMPVSNGEILPSVPRDILKIACIERYGRHGGMGCAFVQGFGLKRGALATSISVPTSNILAVGASDDDIWSALQHLADMQGGFVVIDGGKVLASVRLRIGGIVSEQTYETFLDEVATAEALARELGCLLANPFKTLVSCAHTSLPDLGLSDQGLIDTRTGRRTSVIVEGGVNAGI